MRSFQRSSAQAGSLAERLAAFQQFAAPGLSFEGPVPWLQAAFLEGLHPSPTIPIANTTGYCLLRHFASAMPDQWHLFSTCTTTELLQIEAANQKDHRCRDAGKLPDM